MHKKCRVNLSYCYHENNNLQIIRINYYFSKLHKGQLPPVCFLKRKFPLAVVSLIASINNEELF